MRTLIKVIRVIAHHLDCDEQDIDAKDTLEGIGCDSLDLVELASELEASFNLEINDDFLSLDKKISEIAEYIEDKK